MQINCVPYETVCCAHCSWKAGSEGQPSVEKLQQLWRMLAELPSYEGLHIWPLIPCKGGLLCAPGSKSQVCVHVLLASYSKSRQALRCGLT